MNGVVREAFALGYRVTPRGVLLSPHGRVLKFKSGKYPRFGVWLRGKVRQVYVHHFAAFCFYGEDALNAVCVRHKKANVFDVSKRNIVLGTYSDNELDKPAHVRSRSASIAARATQRAKTRPPDKGDQRWCSEGWHYVDKKFFGPCRAAPGGLNYRCRPCMAHREKVRRG